MGNWLVTWPTVRGHCCVWRWRVGSWADHHVLPSRALAVRWRHRAEEWPGGAASQSFITPSHRWRPSSQAARRRERFSLRVIFTTTSRCCVLDVSINNKLPGGTNEIAFQPCFPYLGWSFVHEAHVRVSLRNQEETKTWRKSWNCSTKVLLRC